MSTTAFPSGIYRISVAGAESDRVVEHQYLTDEDDYVTIRSPNAHPDFRQEWRIEHGKDGNVIIGPFTYRWPSPYLIYDGAPKTPGPGTRVLLHTFYSPLNEWHLTHVHGPRYFIHAAGSDLGISISIAPPKITPPLLDLSLDRQLEWAFEFLRPVE